MIFIKLTNKLVDNTGLHKAFPGDMMQVGKKFHTRNKKKLNFFS
jgi:hypothetical protein